MNRFFIYLCGLVLATVAMAASHSGPHLRPLPNGRQEYVDPERHIAFQVPEDFALDTQPPAVGDPPYQVAFVSEARKVQVRLNMDVLSGDTSTNLATPERVSLWATTYAMNRFARRHPKDVQLASAVPPAQAVAAVTIAGQLPPGSHYKAEKSVFVGVPPNRIYIISMLFDDGNLGDALQLADVLPSSIRILGSLGE